MNYVITRHARSASIAQVATISGVGWYEFHRGRWNSWKSGPLPRRNPLRARVIEAMKRTLQDGKKRVVRP